MQTLNRSHVMQGAMAAAAVLLGASVAIRAQQAPPANLVPLTAGSLASQPDRYVGQTVALYGPVEATLTPTAFSVDMDVKQTTPVDVLVIAPSLQSQAEKATYVTVIGEAMRFDPATLATKAKSYALDLSPELIAKYKDRPMILASSVYDGKMTDLARVPPPPLTPEEAAFDAVMKQVNPTLGDLRKGVEASDASIAKVNATKLRGLFDDTRKFFASRSTADAESVAKEAVSLLDALAKQTAASDWAGAKETLAKVQPLCAQCHNAHRERDSDGNYRVRKGL